MTASIDFSGQSIRPGKIVCVGRNYVAHIKELGNEIPESMVVFNKPASAIGSQLTAWQDEDIHYESEIALLFDGVDFIAAGFGFDLTKRALQSQLKEKSLPWERAKAFQGAALFSDFVEVSQDQLAELSLQMFVDGQLQQQGAVNLMMYTPATILAELGRFMPLEKGDVVMTGTPAGVGVVKAAAVYNGRIMLGEHCLVEHSWRAV